MMGWKIFAVVFAGFAASAVAGLFSGKYVGVVAVLSLAMHIGAAAGLASYAFNLRFLTPTFWRGFSIAYAIFSLLSVGHLAIGVASKITSGSMTFLVALGVPIAPQYFSWLPSRRLAEQA